MSDESHGVPEAGNAYGISTVFELYVHSVIENFFGQVNVETIHQDHCEIVERL